MRTVLACLSLVALVGCTALQPVEVVRVDGLSELSIGRGGIGGIGPRHQQPQPRGHRRGIGGRGVGHQRNAGRAGPIAVRPIHPQRPQSSLRLSVQAETTALLSVLEANLFRFLAGEEVEVSVKGEVKEVHWALP